MASVVFRNENTIHNFIKNLIHFSVWINVYICMYCVFLFIWTVNSFVIFQTKTKIRKCFFRRTNAHKKAKHSWEIIASFFNLGLRCYKNGYVYHMQTPWYRNLLYVLNVRMTMGCPWDKRQSFLVSWHFGIKCFSYFVPIQWLVC